MPPEAYAHGAVGFPDGLPAAATIISYWPVNSFDAGRFFAAHVATSGKRRQGDRVYAAAFQCPHSRHLPVLKLSERPIGSGTIVGHLNSSDNNVLESIAGSKCAGSWSALLRTAFP
jgi:hypothetical protein